MFWGGKVEILFDIEKGHTKFSYEVDDVGLTQRRKRRKEVSEVSELTFRWKSCWLFFTAVSVYSVHNKTAETTINLLC